MTNDDTNALKLAQSFLEYVRANPRQRFWQALRNWSSHSFVLVADTLHDVAEDTYYFKGKSQ